MVKVLFVWLSFIFIVASGQTWAASGSECPLQITTEEESYCASLTWEKATLKKRSNFEGTRSLSPQYIRSRTPGSRWLYSNAKIKIWLASDNSQSSVYMGEEFKIFPFMEMLNGHGHADNHHFYWDKENLQYKVEQVALHQMEGCWSLRWSDKDKSSARDSHLLFKITDYQDLNPAEKLEVINYCEFCKIIDKDYHH